MPGEAGGLPFGPLGADTLFVCIDMQNLFLEPGVWHCADGLHILPNCMTLAYAGQDRTMFTRFITARTADEAAGSWQRYYRHWDAVTQPRVGVEAMEITPDLLPYAAPERVFDKTGHGAFESAAFAAYVREHAPQAMVVFGIETDVCVLATVLTAVDRGIRVIIPRDAVASSDRASHEACLNLIYPRMDQQIEITDTATVLAALRA